MSITRIDCHFINSSTFLEGSSSFVTLNPLIEPGTVVAAGSSVSSHNIGSQVACRLAIQHFTEGVLDVFDASQSWPDEERRSLALDVLERSFKRANSSIYSFGHKLAAGGRLATSLIGLVISQGMVATARAGSGSAFLLRDGEFHPFFEREGTQNLPTGHTAASSQVGANSLVTVELASIAMMERDYVLLFSNTPTELELKRMTVIASGLDSEPNPAEVLVRRVFNEERIPNFAFLIKIGPESIYLRHVV